MQYTLKRAKEILKASSNAYGDNDLRLLINKAIQDLSSMAGWERLRRVLRFSAIGPHFVLPQGCAGIVRACVNGTPAHVRTQDFRFLLSGPGDLNHPPRGFTPFSASNIIDASTKPVMFEPPVPVHLFAMSPSGTDTPVLTIKGLTPEGELRTIALQAQQAPVYDPLTGALTQGVAVSDATYNDKVLQQIVEVTVIDATEYITLYSVDALLKDVRRPIALYNPEIEVPEFHHYELSGVHEHQPVELLVEARIDPMPLVQDSDVLPFPNTNPIEWMIRGDWAMRAGETDSAQKYYAMAAQWLKAQEVTEATVQTTLVINSAFENSLGEVSMDAVNI